MAAQNPWWGKTLRIIGIVLMGLTAAFTVLGGAGTTCVALNPTGFGDKFAGIAPFQWLYILFVVVTLGIGIWGVSATVRLVNAVKGSYRQALFVLAAGLAVGGIHMAASRALRGGSMPVDMVVYTTLIALVVLLLFRLPGIWVKVGFDAPAGRRRKGRAATAIALVCTGLLTVTIQWLMAPTHTVGSINYANVWSTALTLLGIAQLLAAGLIAWLPPARAGLSESAPAETPA